MAVEASNAPVCTSAHLLVASSLKPRKDRRNCVGPFRTCSHKSIHSKSKIDKSQKDDIKFVIADKNATEAFDTAEKSLDLIALFVQFLIVIPRIFTDPGGQRWHSPIPIRCGSHMKFCVPNKR